MIPGRNTDTYFNLDYEGLCGKIQVAKKTSGLKRAQSKLSLFGETRTFAEILDEEVEKLVLYYIRQQGNIAGKLWDLRSFQLASLQDPTISLNKVEDMIARYRMIGSEVLTLLDFLDNNVRNLRKIIQKHDVCFDIKLGAAYFDSRVGKNSKNAQLLPLCHQDGIRAIMSTVRNGFEDLYEAKSTIERSGESVYLSHSSLLTGNQKTIPRIGFGNRLASAGNLQSVTKPNLEMQRTRASNPRHKSTNSLFSLMRTMSDPPLPLTLERSISDLEPVLRNIDTVAEKVMIVQRQTIAEVLAAGSEMALEISADEISESSDGDHSLRDPQEEHSAIGLAIHLLLTFLYLANQYVVAPTSGEYARLLGMTPAMSGVIIGLCPAAALVSSLLYSMWTNHSFMHPTLVCVGCGVTGNLIYGAALQCNNSYFIIIGRLLTGFGGPRVISRRYIADHVPAAKRLIASSQFVTAGAMGLACGPLISSLVELSGVSFKWRVGHTVLMWYQPETAPGWIMAGLWLLALVLVLSTFKEPDQRYMRATKLKKAAQSRLDLRDKASSGLASTASATGAAPLPSSSSRASPSPRPPNNEFEPPIIVVDPSWDLMDAREINNSNTSLSSYGSMHGYSPVNLTTANNNVFNLTGDAMEHAIPEQTSENSLLLLSHSAQNTSSRNNHNRTLVEEIGRNRKTNSLSNSNSNSASAQRLTQLSEETPMLMRERDPSYGGRGEARGIAMMTAGENRGHSMQAPAPMKLSSHMDAEPATEDASLWSLISAEVHVVLVLYIVNKVGQELVISSIPLITQREFGWSGQSGGYFMAVVGASVLPMILILNVFVKNSEERELAVYLSVACVGCLLMLMHCSWMGEYTLFQYVLGATLFFALLNTLEGVIMTLLVKLVAPELARGTFNSGLLATEAGTFGRVVGDFCITIFGASQGTGVVNQLFLPVVVMMSISIALVFYYYERLV